MKKLLLIPTIFLTATMLFACQNQIAQVVEKNEIQKNQNSKFQNSTDDPEEETVSDKNKEIEIAESFVDKNIIKFNDFTIKKVGVEKTLENEKVKIFNAVLIRNNKLLETFEGVEYPLGNEIDFGLFSFIGDKNRQLIISDTSNRYERDRILDLSNDYKLLFDSGDYDIYDGGMTRIDFDDDGIYEIALSKSDDIFGFASAFIPSNRIIFQYDKDRQKFFPASHKLEIFTLKSLNSSLKRFDKNEKNFSDVLKITLNYIYAGKEEDGWKFFDENFVPDNSTFSKKVENRENAKKEIMEYLAKNKIYQYIKSDLRK